MQLRAGEVLSCNGCHVPAGLQPTPPAISHGRRELFASINAGAVTTGLPFPNSNPAFFANQGETMAETRARISCQTDCAALRPSVDVFYDDVWTDPVAAGRPADAAFSYRYNQLTTAAPTSAACQSSWSALCRITIHFRHLPDFVGRLAARAMAAGWCRGLTLRRLPQSGGRCCAVRLPGPSSISRAARENEADHLVSCAEPCHCNAQVVTWAR